ncbi:MAG TPA: hypothetical protein VM328_05640 [Fimbriimonadaceae bacterium]|nr:hypothetical protein [Fimbriimonadaceae bacterium]
MIVTGIYAALTPSIAKANRDLVAATRDMSVATERMANLTADTLLAQVSPLLTASPGGASMSAGVGGERRMVLRNSGNGTALDVEINCDLLFPDGYRAQLGTQKEPYVEAAQAVTVKHRLDAEAATRMAARKERPTTIVRLRYRDTFNNRYESVQEGDRVPDVRKVS